MNWDYPHAHTLPVTPEAGDIDGLQHTNNAVYVRWCEHIAWHHSAVLGLDLDDYRRLDRAMAIRRGEYDYLPPEFLAVYEPAIVAARQPVQVQAAWRDGSSAISTNKMASGTASAAKPTAR